MIIRSRNNKWMLLIIIVLFSNIIPSAQCDPLDTSSEIRSRQKRYLIWKEGVNWVQMIVGIGLPIEIKDQSITVGSVVKAYYLLPTNSSDYTSPTIDYARRKKRSSTRWNTYNFIENYLESYGYGDGKSCLLKTICDMASVPLERKTGIFAEIVHMILTPSSTKETLDNNYFNTEYFAAENLGRKARNCTQLYPECGYNFLGQFTSFWT